MLRIIPLHVLPFLPIYFTYVYLIHSLSIFDVRVGYGAKEIKKEKEKKSTPCCHTIKWVQREPPFIVLLRVHKTMVLQVTDQF